jgi:hypothetical protein
MFQLPTNSPLTRGSLLVSVSVKVPCRPWELTPSASWVWVPSDTVKVNVPLTNVAGP